MGEGPAVVMNSNQSVAMPLTTQLGGRPCSGKVQRAVSCNAFDHSAMGEGPAVVRNSKHSVAMPLTSELWGRTLQWW